MLLLSNLISRVSIAGSRGHTFGCTDIAQNTITHCTENMHQDNKDSVLPYPLLVFTDLDGTLLDHNSYEWSAAKPALRTLSALHIPLIFNTSKTYAETVELQSEFGIQQPIIVENGGAIIIPKDYFPKKQKPKNKENFDSSISLLNQSLVGNNKYWIHSFGPQYQDIINILTTLRQTHGFKFTGFGDMNIKDISRYTGLALTQAAKARRRMFSEPLLWQDSDIKLKCFCQLLKAQKLQVTTGGRFIHVTGPTDKGRAMVWLADYYSFYNQGKRPQLIALGDGRNDIPMLGLADYPVIIRSSVNKTLDWSLVQSGTSQATQSSAARHLVTDRIGPEGWNDAILNIIDNKEGY